MSSATAVLGIKKIQEAFKTLAMLQLTAFMWPQQANIPNAASFDYIVVGAGTAGSVIANRLTEIENARVLLIEAGGDPPVESILPGLLPFLKKSEVDYNYVTENDGYSQQFHKNHGVELTRGKMLGGSSSLNFMAYTRGHYKVYDEWAQITDDDSWKWENIFHYFMKSEDLEDPVISNTVDNIFHGTDGYMKITNHQSERSIKYLKAFKEIGNDIVLETNADTHLGYTGCMLAMADGVRQSTAYAFLRTIKDRPNLFVLKDTMVKKIIFDENKNAIGVEVILKDCTTVRYFAEKEIIISAGAINTPQLLMLSGVGPREHLEDLDVEVISDLPVGKTLNDHVMVMLINAFNNSTPFKPTDPRDYPVSLITGYVTLNEEQDYPDYQTLNLLLNQQADLINFCSFYYSYIDEICDTLHHGTIGKEVLLTMVLLINPESSGRIILRNKNPKSQPFIHTGYYSKHRDLDNHAKYLEDFIKVHDTKVFKSAGSQIIVPGRCGCGNSFDHEYWKCYALCMNVAGYHYSGSCPMGTVVDSRLKVNGVQRLRIADASVMPKIPGANTMAATIMVGEKASDMIKEDYYLYS